MEDENMTIFRMKRSASSQLNKAFSTAIKQQFITVDDAYEMVGLFFLNPDVIQSWTQLLHLKYENYEQFLTEKERQNFVGDLVSEFAQCRERLDPTSRLLLGGSSPTLPSEVTFWQMNFPNVLISNLKKPGSYGCIYGLPRMGKTSLAVNFMELFIADTNLHILTNIVIREEMEQIHFAPSLSEMVKQMATNTGWICFLDETGTFIPKKRALSTENIDFESLGRFIGKLGGRLVLITHDLSRDVPPILQSWISEQYRKTELTSMIAILNKQGGLRMNRIITNIPDCTMTFISEDITSLKFDISIKKLLQDIQGTKGVDRDEQRNAILKWLEQNKRSPAEERQAEDGAMERALQAEKRLKELEKKGWTRMKAYVIIGKEMSLAPDTIRSYIAMLRRQTEFDEEDESHEEGLDNAGKSGENVGEEKEEIS